jgi:hypothetical protein
MAKRARGAHGRPGQRRPTPRTGRPAPRPAADVTAAPRQPVEALAPESTPATAEPVPGRAAAARARGTSAVFDASAAQEYAYVAHDVRRIAVVGGSLFGVLIALFLLIEVLGVIHL